MSLISPKTKKDFLEESTSKNIKQLGKSSNTTVNGYSLYDKYFSKAYLNKTNKKKSKKKENKLNFNSSLNINNSKRINSNNSSNLSIYEGENKNIKKNNKNEFNKIMENYLNQRNYDKFQRKKNFQKSLTNRNIKSENNSNSKVNLNNSRKNFSRNNLINQLSKRKNDSLNKIYNNKIKLTRNKNLSMKDIENFSSVKSLKHINNINLNNNFRKENIYPKKILEINITNKKSKRETSPNNKNNNTFLIKNKIQNIKKPLSKRKTETNNSKITELGKKYDFHFNNENKLLNKNKINKSKNLIKNNSCKIINNYTIKNGESETKTNTLNEKIEKKEDELEGPEIIHYSLVELIQKGRKKMKEISINLNNKNKDK